MILFPAIDLKDGHCVRLEKGDMAKATAFNTDPGAQARAFADQGFRWLHVVDLNGAFAGKSVNARRFEDAGVAAIIYTDIERDGILKGLNIEATLKLARAVKIPVIASGGLASIADIERLLEPDCQILEGAISGRALYDGRLDPAVALRLLAEAEAAGP